MSKLALTARCSEAKISAPKQFIPEKLSCWRPRCENDPNAQQNPKGSVQPQTLLQLI